MIASRDHKMMSMMGWTGLVKYVPEDKGKVGEHISGIQGNLQIFMFWELIMLKDVCKDLTRFKIIELQNAG